MAVGSIVVLPKILSAVHLSGMQRCLPQAVCLGVFGSRNRFSLCNNGQNPLAEAILNARPKWRSPNWT
jgi:hypothetical protein